MAGDEAHGSTYRQRAVFVPKRLAGHLYWAVVWPFHGVVFGGMVAFFAITVVLLGLFSRRSARDYLDWTPTRSPEAEAQNEADDVAQMVAAQNELKRRRGAPEVDEEQMRRRVREDREELRRWRAS